MSNCRKCGSPTLSYRESCYECYKQSKINRLSLSERLESFVESLDGAENKIFTATYRVARESLGIKESLTIGEATIQKYRTLKPAKTVSLLSLKTGDFIRRKQNCIVPVVNIEEIDHGGEYEKYRVITLGCCKCHPDREQGRLSHNYGGKGPRVIRVDENGRIVSQPTKPENAGETKIV